jgi:hypothetical protein
MSQMVKIDGRWLDVQHDLQFALVCALHMILPSLVFLK